jgi:cytochrome c peroxidase
MTQTTLEPPEDMVAECKVHPESAAVAESPPVASVSAANPRLPLYIALLCAAASLPVSLWIVFGSQRPTDRDRFRADNADLRGAGVRPGEPVQPLVPLGNLDSRLVKLGARLFVDKRLSADGTVSCASCHILPSGGADRRRFSVGIEGQPGDVNAPTIYNSAFNFRQFWDGRAATLEDQVDGPVQNRKEMGSTWEHVLAELTSDASYDRQFRAALGSGISRENVRRAIAEFERSLTTPNSRLDRWLRGDDAALTPRELRGYALFKEYQCINCHQGVNLGGSMYQRLGVMAEYFTRNRKESPGDLGRFNVTGDEHDRHVFRVPPLRNVALTAPYFHDGSAKTLPDAVRVMIHDQLGREVVEEDVDQIVAFLQTLTGELPKGQP